MRRFLVPVIAVFGLAITASGGEVRGAFGLILGAVAPDTESVSKEANGFLTFSSEATGRNSVFRSFKCIATPSSRRIFGISAVARGATRKDLLAVAHELGLSGGGATIDANGYKTFTWIANEGKRLITLTFNEQWGVATFQCIDPDLIMEAAAEAKLLRDTRGS